MIVEREHIIKAQQFEIEIENDQKGHEIQTAISILQTSRLEKLLHRIFDDFSQEGKVYHFDRITLDLGDIATWDFEDELLFRLEEALIQFFKTRIRSNGSLISGKETIIKKKELAQLEHFLLWGYFLWNATPNQSVKGLMVYLIENEREGLLALLQHLGKKEVVRKRIIFQFGEEMLNDVVLELTRKEGEHIVLYKDSIVAFQKKKRFIEVDDTNFRNAVWEIVFSFLFVESNGYYHKKNFLQYLIRKTAQKYSLGYENLLKAIVKGVEHHEKTKVTDEFKKIIFELIEVRKDENLGRGKDFQKETKLKEQLAHYIAHGDFPMDSQSFSRSDFQQYFKKELSNNPKETFGYLQYWLSNPDKAQRLFFILGEKVLMESIKKSPLSFFVKMDIFFSSMERKKNLLSTSAKRFFKAVIWQKHTLMLRAFAKGNMSGTIAEVQLLKEINYLFSKQQDIFFHFLEEIAPKLSLEQSRVIVGFLTQNKAVAPEGGQDNGSAPNTMDTPYRKNPRNLKTRWENVKYVINEGSLPWWSSQYTVLLFNSDFEHLWALPKYREEMSIMVRKEQVRQNMVAFLDANNLISVIKTLDLSLSLEVTLFFQEMTDLYKEQPYSIQNRIDGFFIQLKKNTVRWALDGFVEQDMDFIVAFFRQWDLALMDYGNQDQREVMVEVLKKCHKRSKISHLKETFKKMIFNFSMDTASKMSAKPLGNIMKKDFKTINFNTFKEKDNSFFRITEFLEHDSQGFKDALAAEDFRKGLLQELPIKNLMEILSTMFKKPHQDFLKASWDILKTMEAFVSVQKQKEIQQNYLSALLENMGRLGVDGWNLENWTAILFANIQDQLGNTLTQEVMAKTKKRIGMDSFNENGQNLVFSIFQKVERIPDYTGGVNMSKKSEIINSGEKRYQKLGEKPSHQFKNPVYLGNAGLVIVSPFLKPLFERSGLMQNGKFIDDACTYRAIHLLEYVVTGMEAKEEHHLALNKLLCGLSVSAPVPLGLVLDKNEREIADGMLLAVTQQWKALKNTSIEGLRNSFLKREGKLEDTGESYYLCVAQQSYDMLLDQIPWSIGRIKLSWMKKILEVAWR